jgi:hypothetical protein
MGKLLATRPLVASSFDNLQRASRPSRGCARSPWWTARRRRSRSSRASTEATPVADFNPASHQATQGPTTAEEDETPDHPEAAGRSATDQPAARAFAKWLLSRPTLWMLLALSVLSAILERFLYGTVPFSLGDYQPFPQTASLALTAFRNDWILASTGYAGRPLPYVLVEGIVSGTIGPGLGQHLVAAALLPVGGIGMAFLLGALLGRTRLGALCGLAYAYNPASIALLTIGSIPDNILVYSILPWIAWLLYLATKSDNRWVPYTLAFSGLVAFGGYWNPQILFWLVPVVVIWLTLPSSTRTAATLRRRLSIISVSALTVTALSVVQFESIMSTLTPYFSGGQAPFSNSLLGPGPTAFASDLTENFAAQLPETTAVFLLFLSSIVLLTLNTHGSTALGKERVRVALLSCLAVILLAGLWILIDEFTAPVWLARTAFFVGVYEPLNQIGLDAFLLLTAFAVAIGRNRARAWPELARVSQRPPRMRRMTARLSSTRLGSFKANTAVVAIAAFTLLLLPVNPWGGAAISLGGLALDPTDSSLVELPQSLRLANNWLSEHPPNFVGERVAWVPSDPQSTSFIAGLANGYGYVTSYSPSTWTEVYYPLVTFGHALPQRLGSMLAPLLVKFVVVDSSNYSGQFSGIHAGSLRYTPVGFSWQLQYYPSGNPSYWSMLLSNQTDLKEVYRSTNVTIYENLIEVAPLAVYNTTDVSGNFHLSSITDSAPSFCAWCTPAANLGPLFISSTESLANPAFEQGVSNWTVETPPWVVDVTATGYDISSQLGPGGYSEVYQDFNASPGWWAISGWIQPIDSGDSTVTLYEYGHNGSLVGTGYPETGLIGSYEWTHFGGLFDLPNGTVSASLHLLARSGPSSGSVTRFANLSARQVVFPGQVKVVVQSQQLGPSFSTSIPGAGSFLMFLRQSYDSGWTCDCVGDPPPQPMSNGLYTGVLFDLKTTSKVNVTVTYGPTSLRSSLITATAVGWIAYIVLICFLSWSPWVGQHLYLARMENELSSRVRPK